MNAAHLHGLLHSVFFISTHFIRNQPEIYQKIKKVLRKCPASKSQDFKKFSASDSGNFLEIFSLRLHEMEGKKQPSIFAIFVFKNTAKYMEIGHLR